MRVAIVEIMETGHVAMAESLCRIFCSQPANNVVIFTLDSHAANLRHLGEKFSGLKFNIMPNDQSVDDFLGRIASFTFERVYVVTMTKYFNEFARWKLRSKLFLVVHNLDEWFILSLLNNTGKFISGIHRKPNLKLLLYLIKLHFSIPRYKKKILKIVSLTKGSVVVLSESLKKEAIRMQVPFNIEVVPFSVYDPPEITNDPDNTKPLRICVPGIISQYRRNYLALLNLAEQQLGNYKDDFILDFLGGIQTENRLNDSAPVLLKTEDLRQKGFKIIIHYTSFIPVGEYDRELALADIVLGNMNVVLNRHSRYGKTKETGLPFAMIKAAKPGILPYNYPLPEEIISGTIRYENYEHLGKILTGLIINRQSVSDLKKIALKNSGNFNPERIYKQITAGDRSGD